MFSNSIVIYSNLETIVLVTMMFHKSRIWTEKIKNKTLWYAGKEIKYHIKNINDYQ